VTQQDARVGGTCPFHPGGTRRGLLGAALGLAGAAGVVGRAVAQSGQPPLTKTAALTTDRLLPFHGPNQNGIVTPMQGHTYFAAFDLKTAKVADVAALMQRWTEAAARITQGLPASAAADAPGAAPGDSGEVVGLPPSRLTVTFGFGAGLFNKDGVDRFGLDKHRPEAFVDLPRFVGDQLVPERTGGDLSVQACGDDPQATLHAVRQMMRLAYGVAVVRWVQAGFLPGYDPTATPRNLMGFKDGTANIPATDPKALSDLVWVGDEGGAWMRGGSYVVARPIRIALEHWDRMKLGFQEQTVGRHKASGAAIGETDEFAPADFEAVDDEGNPRIAENAHLRLASPVSNGGAQILRRGYSYDNGVSMVAERWPPWRHEMELDAGLLFICYQRDPRAGFIRIFDKMAKFDMLNQFVTHVGGGMFACPGGVEAGRYIGQALFEA
jgi:deferrochelatase/peroxidase EfeB